MIENATVYIYTPTIIKTADGIKKVWGYKNTPKVMPAETFRADVQPKSLSPAQVMQWGLSNREAEAKLMIFDDSLYTHINSRAYIISDIKGQENVYYEIKATNFWSLHGEAILVPVQGES
jgi:hypothetical protein